MRSLHAVGRAWGLRLQRRAPGPVPTTYTPQGCTCGRALPGETSPPLFRTARRCSGRAAPRAPAPRSRHRTGPPPRAACHLAPVARTRISRRGEVVHRKRAEGSWVRVRGVTQRENLPIRLRPPWPPLALAPYPAHLQMREKLATLMKLHGKVQAAQRGEGSRHRRLNPGRVMVPAECLALSSSGPCTARFPRAAAMALECCAANPACLLGNPSHTPQGLRTCARLGSPLPAWSGRGR